MNFVPYPAVRLNAHPDLAQWHNTESGKRDWKTLKAYLAEHTGRTEQSGAAVDIQRKCWFSELPLADPFSEDVEHFRPKASGSPLTASQVKSILSEFETDVPQSEEGGTYPWLCYDHRNYRLVTALTNRTGGKHIHFPVLRGTARLNAGQFPWQDSEYPLFLDPTDQNDIGHLQVNPDGVIMPAHPIPAADFFDRPDLVPLWNSTEMHYMRAAVTIVMFRLNHDILIRGRKTRYVKVCEWLELLKFSLRSGALSDVNTKYYLSELTQSVSPTAPFSLAAIWAVRTYELADSDEVERALIKEITSEILRKSDELNRGTETDWSD